MKKLLPVYIVSFVFSFMLFFYEPITMYMLNFHDFWFDLPLIFLPILIAFGSLFLILSFLFTVIYYLSKKKIVFNIAVVSFFVVFLCTYIQGNYMILNLPSLDGTLINWNNYTNESIVSIVLWVVVIIGTVISCIKFKIENVVKTIPYICLAICFMLISSGVASIRPHSWDKKVLSVSTMKNYNKYSSDKNFIIFLVDAVDSVMFEKVMNSSKDYNNTFKDFTYYKDTTSTYLYTRDSIPYILSGIWNENKDDFITYYNKALDNSLLFKELNNNDYSINLYEEEMKWETDKTKDVDNIIYLDRTINYVSYLKNQTKYVLFKYLPYPLKKYSDIEKLNFNDGKVMDDVKIFTWKNKENYNYIKNNKVEISNNKMFKFIHLEGAHVPFDQDENFNCISGKYDDKLKATLNLINTYINSLKESNVYDNSVIIIMSDHGYDLKERTEYRQNPILFIKGIDEHHDMITSDKKISYSDLNNAYIDLLNNYESTALFSDISGNRERRVLLYKYLNENHMREYIQNGHAWEVDKFMPSGKKFDR